MADRPSWQQLASARRAHLARWLGAVHSRATVEQAEAWLARQPAYASLAASWNDIDDEERAEATAELDKLYRKAAYASRPYCVRCGTCCLGAGPTLYQGDEALWREGALGPTDLCTLRQGEEVFSHWAGKRVVLTAECVRIAPTARGSACRFFQIDPPSDCAIYAQRPRQCRVQRCWDSDEAAELNRTAGLGRWDLMPSSDPAAALIIEHERSCSPARLRELVSSTTEDGAVGEQRAQRIAEMVGRDERFRAHWCRSHPALAAAQELWLGGPLERALWAMGLELATP